MKNSRVEIMAPAGNFVCLDAAIQAGADAVYFGLQGLNMRAGAENFDLVGMRKLCKICKSCGVRAYLTLNTIYFERDLPALKKALLSAKKVGVDAVIAWDFAAVSIASEISLPVYLSTQASVSNSLSMALYAKNFGIRRFVLARECSISDIPLIRKNLAKYLAKAELEKISFEVFAHGAMCVSVSGRCFMSLFNCQKSANRGECLQPCRREYLISDAREEGFSEGFLVGKGYVMSPKDLCTLPFIEKLLDAKVGSLKIEGRNRNAEYVFETVSAYRKACDFYYQNRKSPTFNEDFARLKDELMPRLKSVFNRGFSSGFYMGKPVGDWTSKGNCAESRKLILGRVKKFYPRIGVAQILVSDNSISEGQELQIEGKTTGFLRLTASGLRTDEGACESVKKGQSFSLKVPKTVRKNDYVYIFKKIS